MSDDIYSNLPADVSGMRNKQSRTQLARHAFNEQRGPYMEWYILIIVHIFYIYRCRGSRRRLVATFSAR